MQKEILPLTSLRFVTALYVFLFHIQIYWNLLASGGFARFLVNGSCGMSLFFILSGFVLGYRFNNGVSHYKNYAFSRFSRIYPAYFLAAVLTFPWLIYSLTPYESNQLLRYSFVIFLNIFMLQAWIPQLFSYWNDGGSWSLCVEMFFYALFPFLINRCKNLNNKQLVILLPLFYITSSIPGISWVLFSKIEHLIFYSMPIFRLSEFIIGIICGLLFARGLRVAHPTLGTIFCALQLYLYLGWGPTLGFAGIAHNYATVPFIAMLVFSVSSLSSGWLYRFMTAKFFLYLGRISYSFYSFQALVLMTLMTKHDFFIRQFPIMTKASVLGLAALVTLLMISSISYYLVETKFRSYLNRKFDKRTISVDSNMAVASS